MPTKMLCSITSGRSGLRAPQTGLRATRSWPRLLLSVASKKGATSPNHWESLVRRDYLGFDLRNVDQTVLVPRTFLPDSPNQAGESIDSSRTVPLEIVRGRFDREATDQALVACHENSPLVLSTTVKKVVQRVSINGRLVEIGLADAQMAVEQGQATLERSDDNSVK